MASWTTLIFNSNLIKINISSHVLTHNTKSPIIYVSVTFFKRMAFFLKKKLHISAFSLEILQTNQISIVNFKMDFSYLEKITRYLITWLFFLRWEIHTEVRLLQKIIIFEALLVGLDVQNIAFWIKKTVNPYQHYNVKFFLGTRHHSRRKKMRHAPK